MAYFDQMAHPAGAAEGGGPCGIYRENPRSHAYGASALYNPPVSADF